MKKEVQQFVMDIAFSTSIAAGGLAAYNKDGWLPFNLGLVVAGFIGLSRHHFWRRARSTYDNHHRKMAQMAAIKQLPTIDPDFKRYSMTWKEIEEPEFIFTGDILAIPVHRSELFRFLDIAVSRQRIALYGTRSNRKKVKINWVLSERHFTQSVRPRFPNELYWSIKTILITGRLIRGQKQGASGHLVGEYGPIRYTEMAEQRWVAMFGHTPPRKRRLPIFRRSTN